MPVFAAGGLDKLPCQDRAAIFLRLQIIARADPAFHQKAGLPPSILASTVALLSPTTPVSLDQRVRPMLRLLSRRSWSSVESPASTRPKTIFRLRTLGKGSQKVLWVLALALSAWLLWQSQA